ncbi:MAG: hypothetical protein Kow00106_22550 [Anaerolineae bacterium]
MVEGAQRLEVAPRLLEMHIARNDIHNVEPGFDLVNDRHGLAVLTDRILLKVPGLYAPTGAAATASRP